jgi:hypothetical protein
MWLWLKSYGASVLGQDNPFAQASTTTLKTSILQDQEDARFTALEQAIDATAPHLNLKSRTMSMITANYGFTHWRDAKAATPSMTEIRSALRAAITARRKSIHRKYMKWRNSRVWMWANCHSLICARAVNTASPVKQRYVRRSFAALVPS